MAQAPPQQCSAAPPKLTDASRLKAKESRSGKRKRNEKDTEIVVLNDTNNLKRLCQEGAIGFDEYCAFFRPMAQFGASTHPYDGGFTSGSRHVSSLLGPALGTANLREASEREDFERFESESGMSFEQALGFDLENDDASVNRLLPQTCDTETMLIDEELRDN